MSWTNRMARHGNEKSLHSLQSMHPCHATRSAVSVFAATPMLTSSVSKVSAEIHKTPEDIGGGQEVRSPGNGSSADSSGLRTPSPTSSSTACDSRIPRPSPSSLRRSASLRVRGEPGERISAHHPRATAALLGHQHTPRQHNHLVAHQQQYPDHRIFPVITENGAESPRQRSLSLSLTPARPRRGRAASGSTAGADDSDAESVKSYGSACSTASACDHATFALNGTTWSGRSRKYVVHCSNYNDDNEQYLTPTQRAARQVRKFQALLKEARKEIEDKDREIFRLTKEVVELRLYKASLNSPDERTDSSDALTVRENNPFSPESPCKDLPDEGCFEKNAKPETPDKQIHPDLPSSLADSGHFEDGSVHSKDSVCLPETPSENTNNVPTTDSSSIDDKPSKKFSKSTVGSPEPHGERHKLADLYESRIEEIQRSHMDQVQELKQKHNDKMESLLVQFGEVNTRCCELRRTADTAEARVRELETELEAVKTELAEQKTLFKEQEERHKQMYLKMYAKGQEAARIEQADQILEQAHQTPPKVTVAQLLQQLTVTQAELENIKDTSYFPEPHISADRNQCLLSAQEAVSLWALGTRKALYRRIVEAKSSQGGLDPEITLQFLKSAIYYFLTDKENHHGHLNAIESILGFTDAEKHNIDRIYRTVRK